jgi:hypothetical protein
MRGRVKASESTSRARAVRARPPLFALPQKAAPCSTPSRMDAVLANATSADDATRNAAEATLQQWKAQDSEAWVRELLGSWSRSGAVL